MNIQLLFDIDGTLLLSGGAGWVAMQAAFNDKFAVGTIEPVPVHGRTDRGIIGDLFGQFDLEVNDSNRKRFYEAYIERLPDALKQKDGYLLPGVPELLRHLDDMPNVYSGLLTGNMQEAAWAKLNHFEIQDHFGFGGYGDDDADRNRVAEKALAAARQHLDHPVEPETTIVIGDTPRDVECARWVGCKCIGVLTGGGTVESMQQAQPDLLLKDLTDIQAFVDGIHQVCNLEANGDVQA